MPQPKKSAVGRPVPAPPLQILLVEDHADTLKMLTRLLESMGFKVACAAALSEALALGDQQRFDLLICDLVLADGSGLELVVHLKKRGPIKSIALSGYGTDDERQRSFEAGFDRHLTKPVELSAIQAAITELCG